jgi:hypothetical protein
VKESERKRKKEIKVMGVGYKADKKNHKREEHIKGPISNMHQIFKYLK